jgi:hypothetical protein
LTIKIEKIMTKFLHQLHLASILVLFLLFFSPVFSQNGDPPPPPGEHGQTGNQPPGGGATVGSGLFLMILLGAGYGVGKYYFKRKRSLSA